jgi:catechol 2,3-dioxygenase-like lactoylglutathione lyase family enzyme
MITRRNLLVSLPAAAIASRALAQPRTSSIPVTGLSHMTLSVSDLKRSTDFYQGLFGMPIQARQGASPSLRIGPGPQFLFLGQVGQNGKPGFNHWCVFTDNFDLDRELAILEEHGITKAESGRGGGGGGLSGGAMKSRVRMRGPENGGAKDGTAELYVGDPDGLVVQIQDSKYCGGAGKLGEVCINPPEPAPTKGLLAMEDLSHFTIFVTDAQRSMDFYQSVFAMPIQAHQGPTPLLAAGSKGSFVTIAGGGGGRAGGPAPVASINHASFRMRNFDPDKVTKTLLSYGLKQREEGARGPAGPLQTYISMRMPNRGGAPDGTPELYFTDPDGILLQIQDMSYCGGSGKMGEVCVP